MYSAIFPITAILADCGLKKFNSEMVKVMLINQWKQLDKMGMLELFQMM